MGPRSRRARTHCCISLKRSMVGAASLYSSGSGSMTSTGVWLSGSTIAGIAASACGSAGRRRPSLLRARYASRTAYSWALTSSNIGVGGGGGADSFLRLRNDIGSACGRKSAADSNSHLLDPQLAQLLLELGQPRALLGD